MTPHGLLAPQFGLRRLPVPDMEPSPRKLITPPDEKPATAQQLLDAALDAVAGLAPAREPMSAQRAAAEAAFSVRPPSTVPAPTVIVKRKRLLEGVPSHQPVVAEMPAESANEPVALAPEVPRESKVFRKETATDPTPALPAATTEQALEAEPLVPAVPRRRRRDPMRKPVLLQHVVVARPPSEEPAPEGGLAAQALQAATSATRASDEGTRMLGELQQLSAKVARYAKATYMLKELDEVCARGREAAAGWKELLALKA